jgi:hypothetical protein
MVDAMRGGESPLSSRAEGLRVNRTASETSETREAYDKQLNRKERTEQRRFDTRGSSTDCKKHKHDKLKMKKEEAGKRENGMVDRGWI